MAQEVTEIEGVDFVNDIGQVLGRKEEPRQRRSREERLYLKYAVLSIEYIVNVVDKSEWETGCT